MIKFRPKIVATILARNEEDIIGKNIAHHIREGIHTFIITNNASIDATRSIISQFPEVKMIIDEPELNHNQRSWVSRMAEIACDYKPDWIIHLDADEFWCGIQNIPFTTAPVVTVSTFFQHLPIAEGQYYVTNKEHVENVGLSCTRPKIIHRPIRNAKIINGNHGIIVDGTPLENFSTNDVWVHHYPIRGYNTLLKKATDGAKAILSQTGDAKSNAGTHWRQWNTAHAQNKLMNIYQEMIDTSWKLVNGGKVGQWKIPIE